MCVSLHWGARWDFFSQKEEMLLFPPSLSLEFAFTCTLTAAFSRNSLLVPSGQRVRGDG